MVLIVLKVLLPVANERSSKPSDGWSFGERPPPPPAPDKKPRSSANRTSDLNRSRTRVTVVLVSTTGDALGEEREDLNSTVFLLDW